MRGLILAVVLGAARDAQAPKGSPEPANPGPPEEAKAGSVFRGNVDPKMILPAGPPVDASIRIVAPPAPSCDHRR